VLLSGEEKKNGKMDGHISHQCLEAYYAPWQHKIHPRFTIADVGKLFRKVTWHYLPSGDIDFSFLSEGDFVVKDVEVDKKTWYCYICSAWTSRCCSCCRKIAYCGRDCQRNDWQRHKQEPFLLFDPPDQRIPRVIHVTMRSKSKRKYVGEEESCTQIEHYALMGWARSPDIAGIVLNESLLQGCVLYDHFKAVSELFRGNHIGHFPKSPFIGVKPEDDALTSLNEKKEKQKEPSTMTAEEKDTVGVNELDTTCVICFELWDEDFHTMACGVLICVNCYNTIHDSTCPSCRTGLAQGSHILQPNIKKIMNCHRAKMIVKCSNEKCEVRLTLKQMHHHREHECQYSPILCEDCSCLVTRELYQRHVEYECLLRNVKCMLCDSEVVCNQMDAHIEKDCPSAQIVCKKCEASIIRKDELLHFEQDCPKHVVACKLLCGTIMRRELLAEHCNKCDFRKVACDHCHLAMLYNQLGCHLDVCLKRPTVCYSCNKRFPRQWQVRHARNECIHRWQQCHKISATCHHWHRASSRQFKFHVHDVCPAPFDPHMRLQTGMIVDLFNLTSHSRLWQTILVLDSREEEEDKKEEVAVDHYTIRYKVYVNKTDVNAQIGTTRLERKSQLIAPAWSVNVFEAYINVPIAALQCKRTFCGTILLGDGASPPPCVVGDVHLFGKNWRYCYAIFADKSNTKLELGGCDSITSWGNTYTRMTHIVSCKVLYYFEFVTMKTQCFLYHEIVQTYCPSILLRN